MEKTIHIREILKELPVDFMKQKASEMKVDYKAKKLEALRFFALLLVGFLRNGTMSQRMVAEQSSLTWMDEFMRMDISGCHVSHSSISDRLATINPDYFLNIYDVLLTRAESIMPREELEASNIVRVDTTLVCEASNKLKEGIETGINKRFGGIKRQVKFGMGYDGFAAIMGRVFTEQWASGDQLSLRKTLMDAIRYDKESNRVYVFDRGVEGYEALCDIAEECDKRGSTFVARLQLNRKYTPVKNLLKTDPAVSDPEFEIMEDNIARLNKPAGSTYPMRDFRVIRVRFARPRPRTLPSARRRKYEPEMLLITNDMESAALDIANEYKQRWAIEVFYKFLKQNLSFSHLMSTNVNGIKVMMYMTLIVAVLIKLFGAVNNLGPTMAKERMVVQLENWLYESGKRHSGCMGIDDTGPHNNSSDR